jgi:2-methylisocitrate lyase-like PEP mutase family enzyme
MSDQRDLATRFLALHQRDDPLLLANAWDAGSAKLLTALGFDAIATTSLGFAGTLGRRDGNVTRDEAFAHAAALVAAVDVPVNGDFEKCYADDPATVAENASLAVATGVAGFSVEDATGRADDPIFDAGLARERVAAAAEVAHRGDAHVVLTARAENFLYGRADLADTIARLQSFQEAGADVLYAPAVSSADDIRAVVTSVDLPVNVLALPNVPPVAELRDLGVKRISVGSAFAQVAWGALVAAGRELLDTGTYGFWQVAAGGRSLAAEAFTP